MSQAIIQKAGELIAGKTGVGSVPGSEPFCVLALIDDQGYPTASTITAAKAEGIQRLYFGTGLSSNKAKRIAASHKASVCFNDLTYNITLVGTIEVVTDPALKQEMWYDGMAQHFSCPQDPQFCVLVFTTQRYNLLVDWQEVTGTL